MSLASACPIVLNSVLRALGSSTRTFLGALAALTAFGALERASSRFLVLAGIPATRRLTEISFLHLFRWRSNHLCRFRLFNIVCVLSTPFGIRIRIPSHRHLIYHIFGVGWRLRGRWKLRGWRGWLRGRSIKFGYQIFDNDICRKCLHLTARVCAAVRGLVL
jgi:hypothetical protein